MQEANDIWHHHSDLTFQFCSYCCCYIHSCIHSLDSHLVSYSQFTYSGAQAQLLRAIVAVTRSTLIPLQQFSVIIPLIYSCMLYLFVPYFQNGSYKNYNKTTQLCYIFESAYADGVLDL